MKYHKRIRELREDNDVSQQETADFIGVDRVTYNRLENEKISVKLDYAIKFAEFYKVSLDYVAGITDIPNNK